METLTKKHNRLHKEIQNKATKLSWFYKLNDHEKQEAINNSLLQLLQKEKEGVLNLDNQEEYMGYLFITIKNAIGRFLQGRNTISSISRKNSREVEEYDAVIETESIKLDLSELTPINRAIFRWWQRGWVYKEIGKAVGLSESGVGHRLSVMRRKLSEQTITN